MQMSGQENRKIRGPRRARSCGLAQAELLSTSATGAPGGAQGSAVTKQAKHDHRYLDPLHGRDDSPPVGYRKINNRGATAETPGRRRAITRATAERRSARELMRLSTAAQRWPRRRAV